ncbi:MAG TPA: hypothetical protein VFG29_13330 [Syntrophales bacterium]|nr:hypothetical protein [Syntrophales bacterium]
MVALCGEKFVEKTVQYCSTDTLVMQVTNSKHETIWPQKYASAKYVYPILKWRERR